MNLPSDEYPSLSSHSYNYIQTRIHLTPSNNAPLIPGDQSHMTSGNHSIDYVNNRAPKICGKNYSGLEMNRMAKGTMDTNRGWRKVSTFLIRWINETLLSNITRKNRKRKIKNVLYPMLYP